MRRQPSTIRIEGSVAYVSLTRGLESVIDAGDVQLVAGRRWYAETKRERITYARSASWVDGKAKMIGLHNLIISGAQCVDHRNGNGLDNRRANLRAATFADNARNARIRKDNTSGFKGVKRMRQRWCAQIRVGSQRIYLGSFDTPQEAHRAYCRAAIQHFGAFANFGG